MNKLAQLTFVATSAVAALPATASADHRAVDLGQCYATGINDRSQVIGVLANSPTTPYQHAFLWDSGVMTDLGTLDEGYSGALSINEDGVVVGYAWGDGNMRPVRWRRGQIERLALGALDGSTYYYNAARGINERGQIVGDMLGDDWIVHAFLWQGGVATDLGFLDRSIATPNTNANAINRSGQVVGSGATAAGYRAFLWQNGRMKLLDRSLGESQALGINDDGDVIGVMNVGSDQRGFVWRNGRVHDLGSIGRGDGAIYVTPTAISEDGQITGSIFRDNRSTAFLWKEGRMIDLNTLDIRGARGFHFSGAAGINERGDIAATAERPGTVCDPGGENCYEGLEQHCFLLRATGR